MEITFDKQDIMKALNIYMLLQGYETDGYFDFRWKRELYVSTSAKLTSGQIGYDDLKRYANG